MFGRRSAFLPQTIGCLCLISATGWAQDVNATPSKEPCPFGGFRSVWTYPYEAGLPSNATKVNCDAAGGCYSFPASACLHLVDVSSSLTNQDIPPVFDDPKQDPAKVPGPPSGPPGPPTDRPASPSGSISAVPAPGVSGCVAGVGWDFEDLNPEDPAHPGAIAASLQNWTGDDAASFPDSPFAHLMNHDLDRIPAPVYGNAAPIDNIRPPGWRPDMGLFVGGDYWKYSMPVNQHGDFWISSLYRRYSWRQHPGDTTDESAVGTLTSHPCVLKARFLTFRMGGGRSSSERVELQVRGGRAGDYFGIRFPGGLGDASVGKGHATQSVSLPVVAQSFPPPASGRWVVVRSVTSEDVNQSDWMQTYVFDLRAFRNRQIRIRIVDDSRSECSQFLDGACVMHAPEHINTDLFVFADQAPPSTDWLRIDGNRCCGPVGHVPSPPPLWGITDAHAHPMANIGFGGHVFWGDVTDDLEDIYDCRHSLLAIPGPGGRDAIKNPAQEHSLYLAGDVAVYVTAVASGACSVLDVVPVIGVEAAELCKGAVAAGLVTLLSTPLLRGLELHGADKFSSGAVRVESTFLGALRSLLNLIGESKSDDSDIGFSPGLMAEFDKWPNAKPTIDWYRDSSKDPPENVKWHSFTGLGKSHNSYQADMIRRAFQGGMRLGVWDVINSRALAFIADGPVPDSDWQALKNQTDAAKRIVGTLADIAVIAYSAEQAAHIIESGKMAVILGTEVDELGRMRPEGYPWPRSPHTSGDSMQKQIDDLWELGIRKITPVHAINNPIGGPALFDDHYVANDHFANGTDMEASPTFFDLPTVRFVLDRLPWLPFDIVLGSYNFMRQVGGDGKTGWNYYGWFDFDTDPHATSDGFIDDYSAVNFRVGQSGNKRTDHHLADAAGNWYPPSEVLDDQILVNRAIGDMASLFYPAPCCSLVNTSFPGHTNDFGSTVNYDYVSVSGHRNANGLQADGDVFLRAAMKKGMILDTDHMSQLMRVDAFRLAGKYAAEASFDSQSLSPNVPPPPCDPGKSCNDYPFMGVHSTVRGLEREGSDTVEFIPSWGSTDESTRTAKELRYVSANGGTVGAFPRGSAFIPPNTGRVSGLPGQYGGQCRRDSDCGGFTEPGANGVACDLATHQCNQDTLPMGTSLLARNYDLPAEVQNDCDLSSKTFAVKYLYLMRLMQGRGLTFTTDTNGFLGMIDPRYGGANPSNSGFGGTPGKDVCGGNKRSILDGEIDPKTKRPKSKDRQFFWNEIEVFSQQYEHSGVWYDDYTARAMDSGRAATWTDPVPAPHKRWREVVARSNSDLREDGAPRYPIDETVYFNDRGPELPIRHWYDQDSNQVGQQLWPMKRWNHGHSGWDFNLDGLQHIGLLPDLMQDMRNVGVQWEQLGPLFRGSQDFIDMWRRATAIGNTHP